MFKEEVFLARKDCSFGGGDGGKSLEVGVYVVGGHCGVCAVTGSFALVMSKAMGIWLR